MKPTLLSSAIFSFRPAGRKAAGLLLCAVLLTRAAFAQTYVNNQNAYYNNPNGPFPPQIQATAFDNENVFSVTYDLYVNDQIEYCQPWTGTYFYTNSGQMMVNAPFDETNFLDFDTTGAGYEFDLYEGSSAGGYSNVLAGTFYNPGTIHCDSFLDGNNVFVFDGFTNFFQTSIGGCIIQATNIINPGNIVVGTGGQLALNGQNVNLTRSILTMETGENEAGVIGNAAFAGSGVTGISTNWDPSANLGLNYAYTPFFAAAPYFLDLTNSTPYFQEPPPSPSPNTVIYRSVFIQDTSSSNVAYSVYYNSGADLGGGDVTIQWAGSYLNPATGQTLTNYLYLNNGYLLSGSTNDGLANGYPANFTLTASSTPLIFTAPATAGFQNVFLSGVITNHFAFGSFSSIISSETNVSGDNPGGSLTNLANRIVINATRELNLDSALISGQVYTGISATNQYDGSAGALIASPYSDLNLGVTNGTLVVSNLLEAQFPEWNGYIQAWSTRWVEVDTNAGVTNDYRVLIVSSQLNPITLPQVDNLKLNGTNLVIGDELNVFGPVYANSQTMTVTTNVVGVGATSVEGSLNLENPNSPTWSWSGAFPYLQCLTNNGLIVAPNYNNFTSSTQTINIVTSIPPVAPTAMLSEMGGTNVATSNKVTCCFTTYTFTNGAIYPQTPAYLVKIGPTFDATMSNLIAAINFTNGMGTLYSTNGGYANGFVTAGPLSNHAFTVTGVNTGTSENGLTVSTSATNLTWSPSTLSGGAATVPGSTNITSTSIPYNAIVNSGVFSDQGSAMWVNNFVNGGILTNGVGPFTLNALTALLTNSMLTAGGDISLTANTLNMSNVMFQAGRSVALQVTNWVTDGGVTTNGNPWTNNVWTINSTNGSAANGLVLTLLPTNTTPGLNNLLGTSISMTTPPPNKQVSSAWAGLDYGATALGYNTNNMAIGQLVLNSTTANSVFYFSGPPGSTNNNAIYVNQLVLENYASYANGAGTLNIPTLYFNGNTNMGKLVIYYADAVASQTVTGGPLLDVSYELNGSNTNHLLWVPQYAGYLTTTNIVYPGGTTYSINLGLAQDPNWDSLGNGNWNIQNPYPLFEPSQWNVRFARTNLPPLGGLLTWDSIPSATNIILFATNLASPNWITVTNFVSPGQFLTPATWPITNAFLKTNLTAAPYGFYRVLVNPNTATEYP